MGIVELKADYYRLEDKWNAFAKITGRERMEHLPIKDYPSRNYHTLRVDYSKLARLCLKHGLV